MNTEAKRTYNLKCMRMWRAANPEKVAEGRRQRRALRSQHAVEAKAEQYLRAAVEARGGMCPKFNDPARRGAPDRMVLLPRSPVIFVEMKRAALGRLTKHQERYHADLRALGHRVEVLWSEADVDAFLSTI